jgi:AraC-like DNA-binding protein
MFRLFWNKILILFLFPLFLFAQVQKKDLKQLPYDTIKKFFWDNEGNPKQQLVYANAFLLKAKGENSPVEQARGFLLLSLLSENDKALRYLDSAIVLTKYLNDERLPAFAYLGKANVYTKQFKFKEAIDNYLIAENSAKKNNSDLYYSIKYSIAILRSEHLGEVQKALDLYLECINYYKGKKIRTSQYSYIYQNVIFALADAHQALHQSDSATYYNNLGYRESKLTKNYETNALFTLNEGANLILKGNFKLALDSISKALPKMIAYKNWDNTLAAYYYFGKAYDGLGEKDLAAKNFIKVDSIYKITKTIYPEIMDGYPFLISYYKKKGEKEKQLQYLSQYMTINSVLQKNYKELSQKLQKEYDTPNLFSEKEALIHSLKKDETATYKIIAILVLLVFIIAIFGLYQYQIKKKYRKRFDKIINKTAVKTADKIPFSKVKEIKTNYSKLENIGIAKELVNEILEKLSLFEIQKGYLQSNLTIQTLSNTFESNNKYLSKTVNVYKGKSFIQYINDLRIEYAIMTLKKDNKLINYTIQALAKEFGFNNAESFSTAFHKKTGIKPTYFIKELVELNRS